MKYSFIVPVYNGEKYINRCLDSLLNQTYQNFEIIVINDGSIDKSLDILNQYAKNNKSVMKLLTQKNKGLSASRNLGLSKATGDYILFVDIDDYIHINTLKIINENTKEKYDLLKIDWTSNITEVGLIESVPKDFIGPKALEYLINKKQIFEMAPLYILNSEFIKNIDFRFKEGRYHEDFGIIPITILKANKVLLINQKLYYYDQSTKNSIMRNKDYPKTVKKAKDVLLFFIELKKEISNIDINSETKEKFMSFIANAVIYRIDSLKREDKKEYIEKSKNEGVLNLLQKKTFKQKLKYYYFKYKYKMLR